jgi:hypothetical protein
MADLGTVHRIFISCFIFFYNPIFLIGFDLNQEPVHLFDLNVAAPVESVQRKDASEVVLNQVFQELLRRSKNGVLPRNATSEVVVMYNLGIRTVQRCWAEGKLSLDLGIMVSFASKKRGKCGRKPSPVNYERLRNVPLKERTTLEDSAKVLGVCKRTLLKHVKQGKVRRHTSSIKPHLTDENKKSRLQWCVDMLEHETLHDNPRFKSIFDHVFIDEKWFFITRKSERYYLLPDEDEPYRTCRSKNNIPKLMFLCATARPRFENGICMFDGKIGCFPLVTFERAKRSSINRPAGTMEVKPITSIKRDVIREFMIQKVLPSIKAKWPREDVNKPIYIQQDNAPSHIEVNDPMFCEATQQDGFDVRLTCQPTNSLDFNILDLGFFRAIQSIQYKKSAKTVQDLIPVVQEVCDLSIIRKKFY